MKNIDDESLHTITREIEQS